MDKSDKYIYMCKTARDIQEYKDRDFESFYHVSNVTVWLPRVDQLQDMCLKRWGLWNVYGMFDKWLEQLDGHLFFDSFEQLWLLFVMETMFDKVFDLKASWKSTGLIILDKDEKENGEDINFNDLFEKGFTEFQKKYQKYPGKVKINFKTVKLLHPNYLSSLKIMIEHGLNNFIQFVEQEVGNIIKHRGIICHNTPKVDVMHYNEDKLYIGLFP